MLKLALSSLLVPSLALAMVGGEATPKESTLAKRSVLILWGQSNRCTGTLVSRRLVLTAAHCLVTRAPNYTVAFTTDLTPFLQGKEKVAVAAVQETFANPNFDRRELRDDIGLLLLATPAPEFMEVAPLPEATQEISDGANLTALGFGLQNKEGIPFPMTPSPGRPWEPVQLKQKDFVTSAPTADMQKHFEKDVAYHRFFVSQPESGICVGDSGGPVYWKRAEGEPFLVGVNGAVIQESGMMCGRAALVTRIDTALDWIRDVMAKNAD